MSAEVHRIAEKIVEFDPTVVIVETTPNKNAPLLEEFKQYQKDPKIEFSNPSPGMWSWAFSKYKGHQWYRFQEKYNYRISEYLENPIDSQIYTKYMQMLSDLEKGYLKDIGSSLF